MLSLFWSKYNAFKFNGAIRNQMREEDSFNCSCHRCVVARRYSHEMSSENVECEFQQLFKAKLAELGMIFVVVSDTVPRGIHESATGLRRVVVDAHIVQCNLMHGCPDGQFT